RRVRPDMTSRPSRAAAVGLLFLLAVPTACSAPPADDVEPGPPRPRVASTPEKASPVVHSRAGVAVQLPDGCQPSRIEPGSCRGLEALRLARIGPLDDLIAPGVHRTGARTWVGLRVVDGPFVFAEATNGD